MKKYLAAAVLLPLVLAGAEKGLLFKTSFDQYSTRPEFSANAGTKTEGIHHDLQLRGHVGPDKSSAVVLSNKEYIRYTSAGNIDLKQGSLSLWVQPINWNTSDYKHFSIFFEYRSLDFKNRLILYKINKADSIAFHFRINGKTYPVVKKMHWNPGEWHKLDAVWTPAGIKFYVDGLPAGERKFDETPRYMPVKWQEMGINLFTRGWEKLTVPSWQTGYDDLRIYNRARTAAEIAAEYEKIFPRKAPARALRVTSPGTVPVCVPLKGNAVSLPHNSYVKLRHDSKNLYLDFHVDNKGTLHKYTARDSELWLDDTVEFHVLGKDGKLRQFIVNSAGAVYDSLKGNAKWNSGITASAERKKDFWRVRLTIPLKDLNVDKKFKANFGVCDRSGGTLSYSWSPIVGKRNFAAPEFFGTVELLGTPGVDLTTLGNLRAGKLDIKYKAAPGISVNTSVKCSNSRIISLPRTSLPAGNAELLITGTRQGKEIFNYSRPLTVNVPMVMDPRIYPGEKVIELSIDFTGMGLPEEAVRVTLSGTKNGKVYAGGNFKPSGIFSSFRLPLPELPPKEEYKLTAVCRGESAEYLFRVPDPALLNTRVAIDHTVPAPWTKVRCRGNRIDVLDRTYFFENGPLPSRIISRGKELVAEQPAFILNGKKLSWQPVKFGKNHGDYTELVSRAKFPGGEAEIKGELWFDGMYKFDLALTPEKSLKITSLRLEWATPEKQARYALLPAYTPWKKNTLKKKWDTREYHSLFWLTGPVAGLAWWCGSDANWIIDPNKDNITAVRKGGRAHVSVNMFAHPAELKKTARYTMVFQATPARRPRNDIREYCISQRSRYRQKAYTRMTHVDINDGTAGGYVNAHSIKNWISLVPIDPVKFRQSTDHEAKKFNWKSFMYAMPVHLSTLDEEYKWYYPTYATLPAIGWEAFDGVTKQKHLCAGTCMHLPISDLHAYRIDKLYRENPNLHSLYFDLMHCRDCGNTRHGCSGKDVFGKTFRTSQALHIRSYALRIYKIHRKYGKSLGLHAHNAFFPFVHAFSDFWMPGEEMFIHVANNPEWAYQDAITPEAWQSAWSSTIRGVVINVIPQHERVSRIIPGLSAERKKYLTQFKFAERMIAMTFLYDMNVRTYCSEPKGHPSFRSYDIRQDLQFGKAEFHPYWMEKNADSSPHVKISRYSWDGNAPHKFLLCAVNTAKTPVRSDIRIDWKKLGTPPCRLFDVWNNREYSEKELAETVLPPLGMLLLIKSPSVR